MDANKMEIGWIDREGLSPFRSMLLPGAAADLERGLPLTALGVTQGDRACGAAAAWLSGSAAPGSSSSGSSEGVTRSPSRKKMITCETSVSTSKK